MRLKILILLLLTSIFSVAEKPKIKPYKGGLSIGTANYFGDLCNAPDCIALHLNTAAFLRFYLNEHFSLRPQINYFRLSGNDAKASVNPERNLSFRSDNLSISSLIEYDILPIEVRTDRRKIADPYLFTGINFLFFNPKAQIDNRWIELQPLATEGKNYNRMTVALPLGIGCRFKIAEKVELGLEISYHITATNYLDDISGSYTDPNSLSPQTLALADRTFEGGNTPSNTTNGIHWAEGSQRGSKNIFDSYLLTHFFIEIDLAYPKVLCP